MQAAPSGTTVTKSIGHALVIGGTGFLGGSIVQLLQSRAACTKLSVVDLHPAREPVEGVDYRFGDITDYDAMSELFQQLKPRVVIHTASPVAHGQANEIMYKVNVSGTENLVRIAQENGVKAFVYTSSASVISDNYTDLVYADEEYPVIMGANQPLYYTTTKAQAEQHVLSQNRPEKHPKFLTCSIRPAGMIGTGDVQVMPPIVQAYYKGQTKFQVGENNNLFDFTEVTNVAHAHHLAAAALLTTLDREDQGQSIPPDTERVDGEAFFITNDSPVYFWDMARTMWAIAGDTTKPSSVWTIPKDFGLFIASVLEWIFWIARVGEPDLTKSKVLFSVMTRYYCIDKAKRKLGYRPVVSLKDGITRGIRHAILKGTIPSMPKEPKEGFAGR